MAAGERPFHGDGVVGDEAAAAATTTHDDDHEDITEGNDSAADGDDNPTMPATDNNDHGFAAEPEAMGYTPLDDVLLRHPSSGSDSGGGVGTTMMFMMRGPGGPDSDSDSDSDFDSDGECDGVSSSGGAGGGSSSSGGAFYADLAAFGGRGGSMQSPPSAPRRPPRQQQPGDEEEENVGATATARRDNNDVGRGGGDELDFRALADKALRSLEEEYETTLGTAGAAAASAASAETMTESGTNTAPMRRSACAEDARAAVETDDDGARAAASDGNEPSPPLPSLRPPAVAGDTDGEIGDGDDDDAPFDPFGTASAAAASAAIPAAAIPAAASATFMRGAGASARAEADAGAHDLTATNDSPSASSSVPVDATAIRRALDSIRLQAPSLTSKLDDAALVSTVPPIHPLIPPPPLAAFRKNSAKAKQATANLTRSATLAESYRRLFWTGGADAAAATTATWKRRRRERPTRAKGNVHGTDAAMDADADEGKDDTLVIHLLGTDGVECSSPDAMRLAVGPFVRWFEGSLRATARCHSDSSGAATHQIGAIEILMVGPNVSKEAEGWGDVDLLPPRRRTGGGDDPSRLLRRATTSCRSCPYHEYLADDVASGGDKEETLSACPDLIVAFNAGIWGYDEWRPTLHALCRLPHPTPVVVTAYTLHECDDDAEVIWDCIDNGGGAGGDDDARRRRRTCRCLWNPEWNPFGSRKLRETATAPEGRRYRENGAWQAWTLGGGGGSNRDSGAKREEDGGDR